jgi:hypothetical protein
MGNRVRRALVMAAVGGLAAFTLVACDNNAGGDTTCDQYNSDSVDQRVAAVKKMLSDHSESTSTLAIDTARASVSSYCFLHSGDSKISNVYHG